MKPLFHFTPPQNWMNDPNGLVYYKGYYHIFYQHFPYECHWGTMHWGHAITKDFVSYTHLPIALYPSKIYDQNGCFSGSSIIINNQLYLYYTAIQYKSINENNIHLRNQEDDTHASQALLISEDGFTFQNNKKIKIITEYPQSRDPKAWITKNNKINLAIGSHNNGIGCVLFYQSEDGIHFKHINTYEDATIGDMWECPDILQLNHQYFLMICPENITQPPLPNCNSIIMPIDFDEETCTITNAQAYQFLDYGLDFYAPQSFKDENNQTCLLAWLRMRQAPENENYVGMLCMPRVLSYQNGHIYQSIYPTVDQQFTIPHAPSLDQPFKLSISLDNNQSLNLGNFIITYQDDTLVLDRTQVSIHHKKVSNISISPKLNHQCDLTIYYDYNIFEIFINNGQYVMSQIVYHINQHILQLPHSNYTCFTAKGKKV